MKNYKDRTKEIIISDNKPLLHCVYLYVLIHIIIYIFLVGNACHILLSYTTATKISQNLVLTLPPIYHIQQQKTKSATSVH